MPLRLGRRARAIAPALLLAALAVAVPASADEPPKDDGVIILTLDAEQRVDDLLRGLMKLVGKPIYWASDDKAISGKRIVGMREFRVSRGRLFSTVREILASQEIVLIQRGVAPLEIYEAADARALPSQLILKGNRTPVELTDANLTEYESQYGLFVMTTITLQNSENLRDAGAVLQQMATGNNVGTVQELPAARAFLVIDFAPNVVGMYRAIRKLDVRPEPRATSTEFFELKHADASNVARVLTELFAEKPSVPAPAPSGAVVVPPAQGLRISADPQTDTVVVVAPDEHLFGEMHRIVERLDRAPAGQ